RLELIDSRAGGNERRGAVGLGLGGALGEQCSESLNPGIARIVQQLAILVNEPPERVVENLPARGIGCRRGLLRKLYELPRYLDRAGRCRMVVERRLPRRQRLVPSHLRGWRCVSQERARRGLPALERRLDLDRLHRDVDRIMKIDRLSRMLIPAISLSSAASGRTTTTSSVSSSTAAFSGSRFGNHTH